MKSVKITVLRKVSHVDLQKRFENPIEHTCDLAEGDVFISVNGQRPEGLCESAWESMRQFVEDLANGKENFYDGWMKDPKSAMISCNDGFRPVSFYLEAMDNVTSAPEFPFSTDNEFMRMAIEEAYEGITKGEGGPFGCVIVKDGKVVGKGHNMVVKNLDPTAHGEVSAIRAACKTLGTFDLSKCELYTTGEPCHMCLCAILWANISKVYYGCTIADNALIGFRDEKFDSIFGGRDKLPNFMEQIEREACLKLFEIYKSIQHIAY